MAARRPLPTRYSAKVVAAAQGIVLVLVAAGHRAASRRRRCLSLAALAVLVWSFGTRRALAVAARAPRSHAAAARAGCGHPRIVRRRPGSSPRLAAALVFVALVLPNRVAGAHPGGVLRMPVEAVLGAAMLLVLSARLGRVLATVAGLCSAC